MDISNQLELENFLSSSHTNGVIVDNISVNSTFNFVSTNGKKIITSVGGVYKIKKVIDSNTLENDSRLLYSLNNTTDGGFTIGENIDKDMDNTEYTSEFDPQYYPQYFPGMSAFIDENIVAGDKTEEYRRIASYWDDWADDVFDDWGFFYLYDVESGKYYFPLFNPQNEDDGVLTTQTFNAFGSTFTITHGYPVQGIFKFDILVDNNKPFKFGAYGDMGSDGDEVITHLTHSYVKNSTNLTLYYVKQEEEGDNYEIIYSYFIPRKVSQNGTRTYDFYQEYDDDENSLMSKTVTNGLIVYFSKTNDVKEWVANDLEMTP
jgi:hypothetical protein